MRCVRHNARRREHRRECHTLRRTAWRNARWHYVITRAVQNRFMNQQIHGPDSCTVSINVSALKGAPDGAQQPAAAQRI
jgi:hypothetical protein